MNPQYPVNNDTPSGSTNPQFRPTPIRVPNVVRLPRKDAHDERRDGPQTQPTEDENNPLINSPGLSGHIYRVWTRARLARTSQIDGRLLKCLAAKKGQYTHDQEQAIQQSGGSSMIYRKLTSAKCRALVSWMMEIMLPANDKAWGIEPTPEPDVPEMEREALIEGVASAIMEAQQKSGKQISLADQIKIAGQARDEYLKSVDEVSAKASKRMEKKIEDRLAEGGWSDALIEFFDNFATYPTAILEGPVWEMKRTLSWDKANGFKPIVKTEPRMMFYARSPFDAYPSPHAASTQDGDFCLRVQMHASDLWKLQGLPGYSAKAIQAVLQAGTSGKLDNWLGLEQQRRILEGSTSTWRKEPETYDGIKYFGRVRGDWLQEWARDAEQNLDFGDATPEEERTIDPMGWYDIKALQIGNDVIFAELNPDPLGRRTIHSASYDPVPEAFWGNSVPDLCRDSQGMANACARSLEDNLALCAGPQIVVHTDLLTPGANITGLHPMAIWQVLSTTDQGLPLPAGTKPIDFIDIPCKAQELIGTMEEFERFADDETGIPRYSYGNEKVGGAGDTATGLSMLMNAAAKGIRRAVTVVDHRVIKGIIEQIWTYEMLNNDDPTIKADCKVVPRGAAAILIKEQMQQARLQFLAATANPLDAPIVGKGGREALLKGAARSMELPVDEIFTGERESEQASQAPPPQPSPDKLVDAKVQMAKIDADREKTAATLGAKMAEGSAQRKHDAEQGVLGAVTKVAGRNTDVRAEPGGEAQMPSTKAPPQVI